MGDVCSKMSGARLRLYRGISVKPELVRTCLRSTVVNGLNGEEGRYPIGVPNVSRVRERLPELLALANPSVGDIHNDLPFKGICACGDEYGARYYALKHNKSKEKSESILISFTVDIDRIFVDCRDFLCPAFQGWDHTSSEHANDQLSYLSQLFGDGITPYFERCTTSSDQGVRVAMCNLASFDELVVRAHYKNTKLIGGRYGTLFKSAFFVQAPITPSEIETCEVIGDSFKEEKVFIDRYIFQFAL